VHNVFYCRIIGQPFVKRFALCYRSVVCLSIWPVCDVSVLWPNGWTDQDETWQAGRPRPWPYCVGWGPSSSSTKRGGSPNFWPISVVAKWHGSRSRPLGIGLSPIDIVLDGDPAPSPKRGRSPQFSAHICCGEMAGWMKMPLGTEIGLCSGHIVLEGDDPAPPPPMGHSSLRFSAHICYDQTAGWNNMPLGTEVGLGPTTLC